MGALPGLRPRQTCPPGFRRGPSPVQLGHAGVVALVVPGLALRVRVLRPTAKLRTGPSTQGEIRIDSRSFKLYTQPPRLEDGSFEATRWWPNPPPVVHARTRARPSGRLRVGCGPGNWRGVPTPGGPVLLADHQVAQATGRRGPGRQPAPGSGPPAPSRPRIARLTRQLDQAQRRLSRTGAGPEQPGASWGRVARTLAPGWGR